MFMTTRNTIDALRTMGYGVFRHEGIWTAYRFDNEAMSVSDDDLENVYHGAIKLGRKH